VLSVPFVAIRFVLSLSSAFIRVYLRFQIRSVFPILRESGTLKPDEPENLRDQVLPLLFRLPYPPCPDSMRRNLFFCYVLSVSVFIIV